MQDGVTRYPSIMSMSGLGEIWEDKTLNGFKLIRDHYDALTIIMNPNYSHHSCELQITLVKDFQMLDLSFTQIPSHGYLIDRIEWDPTITKSKQYNTSNWDERFIRRSFRSCTARILPSFRQMGRKPLLRHYNLRSWRKGSCQP